MRRFGRFIILAVVGFALGAGIAYVQAVQEAKKQAAAPQVQVEEAVAVTPADTTETQTEITVANDSSTMEGAAVQPAESAVSEAAVDMSETAPAAVNDEVSSETASVLPTAEPQTGSVAGSQEPVPGSTVGGAFALTDHNGAQVTEKSWPGKYKVVFFGFTHCPDICPTTLDKLTDALNTLGTDTDKLQPLFITTDAKRDTADVMKAYVGGYHASIIGLTGTEEQLKAAQSTYKVYAAKVAGADENTYTMDHSSYVFLMSPDDQMLEVFGKDVTAADMVARIKARVSTAP